MGLVARKPDFVAREQHLRSNLLSRKYTSQTGSLQNFNFRASIGVAPITQLCTCVIKKVTIKEGHLMW